MASDKPAARNDLLISRKQAALLDMDIAEKYLRSDDKEQAWESYKQAADLLLPALKRDMDAASPFISAAFQLSNLSFALGKGFKNMAQYLHRAHEAAEALGDRRSHAMLNMHLGRLYYFSDRRADAIGRGQRELIIGGCHGGAVRGLKRNRGTGG